MTPVKTQMAPMPVLMLTARNQLKGAWPSCRRRQAAAGGTAVVGAGKWAVSVGPGAADRAGIRAPQMPCASETAGQSASRPPSPSQPPASPPPPASRAARPAPPAPLPHPHRIWAQHDVHGEEAGDGGDQGHRGAEGGEHQVQLQGGRGRAGQDSRARAELRAGAWPGQSQGRGRPDLLLYRLGLSVGLLGWPRPTLPHLTQQPLTTHHQLPTQLIHPPARPLTLMRALRWESSSMLM